MELKTFFSNPKIMASSGLLAMLLKVIVTSLIAIFITCFIGKKAFTGIFIIIFPMVALAIDLNLYRLKDKLWNILPEPNSIPVDWEITPEQLFQYAKYLPKVRLMRFVSCWFLIPFVPFGNGLVLVAQIMAAIAIGFVFSALFDGIWLNIFKLKRPGFPIKFVKNATFSKYIDDCDANRVREQILRNNNPIAVGSPAWFAQQAFNSR